MTDGVAGLPITSEEMIAKIITFLFPNGVVRADPSVESIGLGHLRNKKLKKHEDPIELLFGEAMLWLKEEGVIRVEHNGGHSFTQACLTSYGFALLGQKLVGGQEGETVGQAVKNVSENGTDYSRIGDLVGGLLGGFTKSLGSG